MSIRILHLEDDPGDAVLIAAQLRRAALEAQITLVSSREPFERALRDRPCDIILSDFHLPGFDGLGALALARAAQPQTPFILVTGALGDERAVDLLRSGATDFVLKDRLARLVPAIRRALAERAEREAHAVAEERLAQADRLSKMAAAAARMGTWQYDVIAGTLACSDEFLELIGVPRSRWSERMAALEAIMHPEDAQRFPREVAEAVQQPGGFLETEFRIHRPDGEVRWMHCRGDCAPQDSRARIVGVMLDITARKRMEEALRESDRRKDEFLAMVAHELRNPLTPITNGLKLLRQPALPEARVADVHAMLDRQLRHLVRLVDDLLDMSRITLGKIELQRAPVELGEVVSNAVAMSRAQIEAAGHRLSVTLPEQPVTLHADAVRLCQVLSNLLNNAARYTEDGGSISLHAAREDNQLVIGVRDTGIGIPQPMLKRVFDLFSQLDAPERSPRSRGLGIGLAMVRKLVALHGGVVEARSEGVGKGSEFIVRLPVRDGVQVQSTASQAAGVSAVSVAGCSVLVVDDNVDAADSLALLLTGAGARVQVAYDAPGALELLSNGPPDLIVLDIGLPDMNGYALASRIRQDPRLESVRLVALTGFGQEEDRRRSRAAGFDHHLTKPASLDALCALLSTAAVAPRPVVPDAS